MELDTRPRLTPYMPWHAPSLHKLVTKNAGDLRRDFPDVPERYSSTFTALRSVCRAMRNDAVFPYLIQNRTGKLIPRDEATYKEWVRGDEQLLGQLWTPVDTKAAGVATLIEGDDDPYIAYWVDKDARGTGIGSFAAMCLTNIARARGHDRVSAYVRPENIASVSVVESLGFRAVGSAAYADLGDNVAADRQKFSLDLSAT